MTAKRDTAHTETVLRVHYPITDGRIVLRCDSDWDADIEASSLSSDAQCTVFRVSLDRPFRYYKPVLAQGNARQWAQGKNYLLLAHGPREQSVYPYFFEDRGCTVCDVEQLATPDASAHYAFRVFTPPGYGENTLKRYPVLYLQDGQNVFFPSESFSGADWRIRETLSLLNDMNVIDKVIAVGIYPQSREKDYTLPGYESYGQVVAQTLKARIDRDYRTLDSARDTAVMGSSLGGVVSLYLAWQWPGVFGMAACLSSTFGWRDDLLLRIAAEPSRDIRIYLDSGWPQDNYEVTRDMQALLSTRGYSHGGNLQYFAFPGAHHNEKAWALRSHLPFQFLFSHRPAPTRPLVAQRE